MFFSCNDTINSLVVYIQNAPYITQPNTSTYQLSCTYDQRDAMIANRTLVATQGDGSAHSGFRVCLGCAILARSFTRTKATIPSAYQTCFNSCCWNGTIASQIPSSPYVLALLEVSPAGSGLNATGSNNGTLPPSNNSTSGRSGPTMLESGSLPSCNYSGQSDIVMKCIFFSKHLVATQWHANSHRSFIIGKEASGYNIPHS